EVEPGARSPFAVLVWFAPTVDFELGDPLAHDAFLASLDRRAPGGSSAFAVRIDGEFELIKARSVPRQSPPYRPLAEVVGAQHACELADAEGTMVGLRFPDYSEGLEVSGSHLHFISADRSRGGPVLECMPRRARVGIDPSADLHVELPPGVDLSAPALSRE